MNPSFMEVKLKDARIVEPKSFTDARGYFTEAYNVDEFKRNGILEEFVQDNLSFSKKNVLRGMHFQKKPHEISKLVQCVFGEIYDVIVDLRQQSPTFQQWEGFVLSRENKRMLYVPKGFAHGFCVTSEQAVVVYKVDDFFYPEADMALNWNDPTLNIFWPIDTPIISDKDRNAPMLSEILDQIHY